MQTDVVFVYFGTRLKIDWMTFAFKELSKYFILLFFIELHANWTYFHADRPRYTLPVTGRAENLQSFEKGPFQFYWGNCSKKMGVFEAHKYSWSPVRQRLSKPSFCASRLALTNTTILFVGDSVQGQMFRSFAMLTNATFRNLEPLNSFLQPISVAEVNTRHEVRLDAIVDCERTSAIISFRRNEYLTADNRSSNVLQGGVQWHQPWFTDLLGADFAVLNAGLHARPTQQFQNDLRNTFRTIQNVWSRERARIVYRETVCPVDRCTQFQTPLRPEEVFELPRSDLCKQNDFARDVVSDFGGSILDVEKLSHQRPDDHGPPHRPRDCVHFCLPGTPDTWNDLLFAKLASI